LEGKVHSRTGHEGQEKEQRYRSTLSLTSELDVVGGQRHAPAALPPGMTPGTHYTGGWVGPGAAWKGARNLFHTGIPFPDLPARSKSMFGQTDKNVDKSKRD